MAVDAAHGAARGVLDVTVVHAVFTDMPIFLMHVFRAEITGHFTQQGLKLSVITRIIAAQAVAQGRSLFNVPHDGLRLAADGRGISLARHAFGMQHMQGKVAGGCAGFLRKFAQALRQSQTHGKLIVLSPFRHGGLNVRLGGIDQSIPSHHIGHSLVQSRIARFNGGTARCGEGTEGIADFLEKASDGALAFKLPFFVQLEVAAVFDVLEHLLTGFDTHGVSSHGLNLQKIHEGHVLGRGGGLVAASVGGGAPLIQAEHPVRRHGQQIVHDAGKALQAFMGTAQRIWPADRQQSITADNMLILVPAFTITELTRAFQIGFLLYLPFVAIDLIISNILLAMGMMMVSPMTISLPFKLLLFVTLDGWLKISQGLLLSYQ